MAALYARAEPVRSFLRVLSPVPVIFLCLFLFTDPISKVAFPDEAQARTIGGVSQAPIVVVLLDELPSNTLIGENDKLDTKRFPGFGELARNATWFRNAYTVYDSTERAQPAIMDGNLPEKDKLPTSADHPNSIFALFGKTHRLNVSEEATTVCSRDLCEDQRLDESYPQADEVDERGPRAGLAARGLAAGHGGGPDVGVRELGQLRRRVGGGPRTSAAPAPSASTRANLNGGREARFEEWIENIKPGRRPSLNFKHSLLPHVPWQYLPDTRRYRRQANDPIPGLSNQSYKWQSQLDVLLQRHFLQTGFADHDAPGPVEAPEGGGDVGQVADRGRGRPRRRVPSGARAPAADAAERRRDRPDPAADQGARPEAGQDRQRVGLDDRHPADDLRHARTSTRA